MSNLILQSFCVVLQNKRSSRWVLCRELFFLFTLVSPGVHAYRVAKGEEQPDTDTLSPHIMLMYCKCADIGGEAIPGLIIQLRAILSNPSPSRFALMSVGLSAATTAFGVVTMFYDKDTNERGRLLNPSFYGAFPVGDARRTRVALALMTFTFCHVFGKCLGLALLWCTFGGFVAGFAWVIDLLLFILIKIARG